MNFKKYLSVAAIALTLLVGQTTVAQDLDPDNTIVENAMEVEDLTTLVTAVKAADLVEALSADGPFTVFAPTNYAFTQLPEGTLKTVLMPENKEMLVNILTYHVVAGDFKAADVIGLIDDNNGKASVKTLAGGTLTFWTKGDKVYVRDANGTDAEVVIPNVENSNGTVHVINKVLLPTK